MKYKYSSMFLRDKKLGNTLLDDSFTPKIAEFVLSRLFPEESGSHTSLPKT